MDERREAEVMGFFDEAKKLAEQNKGLVDGVIDKAGEMVDEQTGHKFSGMVDKGKEFAKGQIEGEAHGEAPSA
jgi:hypothetical protein